ncbi:MAG: C25 family cysteine peptidase [Chloroflexota bacterium]
MTDQLTFNGIDAATGDYLLPPVAPDVMAAAITGEPRNPEEQAALAAWWNKYAETNTNIANKYIAKEGTDYNDLSSAGWGVIFPYNADAAVVDALRPLLDWRKSQAGKLYKEYTGPEGYRFKPGEMYESKDEWCTRHGAGPGPVDPEIVPYYLLLVGDPDQIPYRFQTLLDVQYAVGRIHFDKPEDYANYAKSVVEAEKKKLALAKTAAFFGVSNPDDPATNMSSEQLVRPLAETFTKGQKGWKFPATLKDDATKAALGGLFTGKEPPAMLFTASHGMGFPNGHPQQLADQGALLCQDWPGPKNWRKPIGKDFYFAADDLTDEANVHGMLAFFFACYGAGTPKMDDFSKQAFKARAEVAPKNFLARLPQRLLSHPKGGALAVVGHVERAWGYSFMWGAAGAQLTVFESALKRLFDGYPIGYAFEYFNGRYAELSADLSSTLEEKEFGKKIDPADLAGKWTANNDARNYVVLGDPFARLMV